MEEKFTKEDYDRHAEKQKNFQWAIDRTPERAGIVLCIKTGNRLVYKPKKKRRKRAKKSS